MLDKELCHAVDELAASWFSTVFKVPVAQLEHVNYKVEELLTLVVVT